MLVLHACVHQSVYLSLHARSGVAGLVSAFQCMSRGHEPHLYQQMGFVPTTDALKFFKSNNQEIRAKCVLNSNMAVLLKVGGAQALYLHTKQHTSRLNIRARLFKTNDVVS